MTGLRGAGANEPAAVSPRRLQLRIFLLSALILFVEMLLIRWIATELRVFSYVQNGILVAAFLGLGLGCRSSRTRNASAARPSITSARTTSTS